MALLPINMLGKVITAYLKCTSPECGDPAELPAQAPLTIDGIIGSNT
jgi:hypothetical protein